MTHNRSAHRLYRQDSDRISMQRKGEALTIASTPPGGSASLCTSTILLVEDDPVLTQLFDRILVSEGFAVTSCGNGMDALRLLAERATTVDVVLSDVRLPVLTGDRLAGEIRRIRPELPILLMTGFSETVTAENAGVLGVAAVLQKPLSARHLVAAIHVALAGARREGRDHRPGPASANRNVMT